MRALRWLAAALVLAVRLANAQAPPTVVATVTPSECAIGQSIAYQAEVTTYASEPGRLYETPPDFAGFVATPSGEPSQRLEDGRVVRLFRYQLVPEHSGELIVQPFAVVWEDPADGQQQSATSDSLTVVVRELGLDDTLRGPKPPVPVAPPLWPKLVLAALGLAVLLWLVQRARRRRPVPVPAATPAPPPSQLSARDRALAALAALEARGLPEAGHIDEYHIRLSQIVREFISSLFDIAAATMATSEIAWRLEDHRVPPHDVQTARQVLYGCDLEKFAAYTPSAKEMVELAKTARSLIIGLALGRE